ncbi:endonuclease/exonuclease/phosphatase family protein [Paeniglutamicibacter sp.]|uniref:endonuclease/exonuclease/phosphatase family protein n=1 Tax=Paeniglutamicibacter sp. TaxID=1934391 RepID=UPI003989F030
MTEARSISVHPHSAAPIPYAEGRDVAAPSLRVATFNASLNRPLPGQLAVDLSTPLDTQAQAVAEIVQRNAPDVLLLNEFDHDLQGAAAEAFKSNYLARSQGGQAPIDYPYTYLAPANTGIPSGADLDGDGIVGGPADALGYGDFEGQYGMVLFSKYPIDAANARTFQKFLWKDMPNSQLPTRHYGELVRGVLRLPSKSMWDVPVTVGDKTIHVIAAHPTPPVFDGPEKRNQARNHDEIRLINDYLGGEGRGEYIYDDSGKRGALEPGSDFVVLGDLNSDAASGESDPAAITALLGNPSLVDPRPAVAELPGDLELRGIAGITRSALGTADFGRGSAGVLRVDYVLPSATLPVRGSGVYWPGAGQDGGELVSGWPPASSDHRLVWVDVTLTD